MPETGKPMFHNAPGNVVRRRRNGEFVAYWIARADLVKYGFKPAVFPLWRGVDPSKEDRMLVSQTCNDLQEAMHAWNVERKLMLPPARSFEFDGTVLGLINCYVHDADSPFRKLRWASRNGYYQFLKLIERDHGSKKIAELKARDMLRWHENWSERGVSMAHGLIKHLRGMLTFGKTILDDDACAKLSSVLSDMRFTMAQPRTAVLTAEQANVIRNRAHAIGMHSIALAQAIQFEGMLRQRDVIGQWVPLKEPGVSDIIHRDLKWIWGVKWEEFDQNLTLRHVTSKRKKMIEIPLGSAPMFMEEMALRFTRPSYGPVIVCEVTGLPYLEEAFRRTWRQIANDCGVPKNVQNRDARAGAISEATDAGADLEMVRHAATHSNIAMTARYSRRSAEKTAEVLRLRVEHRNKE